MKKKWSPKILRPTQSVVRAHPPGQRTCQRSGVRLQGHGAWWPVLACAWGEVSGAVAASIAGIGGWPGPFVRGWLPSESCLLRAVVCRFCRSAWLCPLAGAWALWRGLCVEREPWLRSGAHRVLPHSARSLACLLADLYRTSRPTSSKSGSSKIESPTSQTKLSGI